MTTNTIEDNLIWLEQETKINNSLSIAQETRAKMNVISLAVSTIKDLKKEVDSLKNEVRELKIEISQIKKGLSDEEKKILKIQATPIIKPYLDTRANIGWEQAPQDFIDLVMNIITNKSKTIEQGLRVTNKLSMCIQHGALPDINNYFNSNGGIHLYYSKDYKIVYYALYEMRRYRANHYNEKGGILKLLKPIDDGGFEINTGRDISMNGSQI